MSSNPTNGLKVLLEFMGTFFLCASINLSTSYLEDGSQVGNPLLIIATFYSAITVTRAISGGHINPAVTLAVHFEKPAEVRSKDQQLVTLYIIAQVLGALSACFFSFIFYRENVFQLTISHTADAFHAFIAEIICTFLFIYTILCQGDSNAKLTNDNSISTLIVSLALFAGCSIAGNISGGCLNPAIGFAQNFVRLIVTGNSSECKYLWVYILGPSLGGLLAAYVYSNFFKNFFYQKNKIAVQNI